MIASNIKRNAKSSFTKLGKYITNEEKQGDLKYTQITNCNFSESLDVAMKEIELTQQKNTRSKKDKTYHLVISFAEGEQLNKEQLTDIENKVVEKLGYEEHQRISALHTDTNNWHIHVAINKVNPNNFRNVDIHNDFKKLSDVCREIEKEYGLTVTNGMSDKRDNKPQMKRAGDLEANQGIESLTSWIKREVLPEIEALLNSDKPTWEELHKILGQSGLLLRKRGNGLVIQDIKSQVHVKASSIDRKLSKKSIETLFGTGFIDDAIKGKIKTKRLYEGKPLADNTKSRNALWDEFVLTKKKNDKTKADLIRNINIERKERYQAKMDSLQARRAELNKSKIMNWRQKKSVRAALLTERLQFFESERIEYAKARASVEAAYPTFNWTSFLQHKSENGSKEALSVLRSGKHNAKNSKYSGNHIYWSGQVKEGIYKDINHTLDKRGRVQYHINKKEKIFDDKHGIRPTSTTRESVKASLDIAISRYGKNLIVNGSDDFISQFIDEVKNIKTPLVVNGTRYNQGKNRDQGIEL